MVAVTGFGVIGLGAIVALASKCCRGIVIHPYLPKTAVGPKLQTELALVPTTANIVPRPMAETNGDGIDLAVWAVGLPATLSPAIDLASFAGRVVSNGYSKQAVTCDTKYFNPKALDILRSRNALIRDSHAVTAFLERIGTGAADRTFRDGGI